MIPDQDARKIALKVEVARWVNNLKRCGVGVEKVSREVEKHLAKLGTADLDYLAELALTLSDETRNLADLARKAKEQADD